MDGSSISAKVEKESDGMAVEEDAKKDIFSLPDEVIDCYVLPNLEWNDLLRIRRVCKWTKEITDCYMKVHPELAPEIEINEEEKSFGAFLEMDIPTERIFLNNKSGAKFYEDTGDDAVKFVERFGLLIRSLRVDQLSVYIDEKEWNFLKSLKNLKNLEAGRYGGSSREMSPVEELQALGTQQQRHRDNSNITQGKINVPFPEDIFKQVKVFKLGNHERRILLNLDGYCDAFLSIGESLESVALPFNPAGKRAGPADPEVDQFGPLPMSLVSFVFRLEGLLSNCKEIDFANYHDYKDTDEKFEVETAGSLFFLKTCESFSSADIKLLNVASGWFIARQFAASVASPDHGLPVVSFVNLHPCVLSLNMPQLEKIVIRATSGSSAGTEWRQGRPQWTTLKTLDITVDSNKGRYFDCRQEIYVSTKTKALYDFFFQNITREALSELKLTFVIVMETENLPVPKVNHIVSACPSLKKLTIINWPRSAKTLSKLWNGLPSLEELLLENCKDVGDGTFLGENQGPPVFLNLTKLRKLSLKGLDWMPKITDTLFSQVIRHMELTHLTLTSEDPVASITLVGIRSLRGGRFAETIERFPFRGWRLSNVSTEEFRKHEAMFRSFNML